MRLGYVKDQPYEVEPEIRSANLFAFDLSSVAASFSPISNLSPNGLSGGEACALSRFAGMSEKFRLWEFMATFLFAKSSFHRPTYCANDLVFY